MLTPYLLGISKMTIFGFIKSTIFILFEEEFHSYLKKFTVLDKITRPVFIGGISAAFAMLVASYLKHHYFGHLHMIKHPVIDFIGVMIGTLLSIICYNLVVYFQNKEENYNKL